MRVTRKFRAAVSLTSAMTSATGGPVFGGPVRTLEDRYPPPLLRHVHHPMSSPAPVYSTYEVRSGGSSSGVTGGGRSFLIYGLPTIRGRAVARMLNVGEDLASRPKSPSTVPVPRLTGARVLPLARLRIRLKQRFSRECRLVIAVACARFEIARNKRPTSTQSWRPRCRRVLKDVREIFLQNRFFHVPRFGRAGWPAVVSLAGETGFWQF